MNLLAAAARTDSCSPQSRAVIQKRLATTDNALVRAACRIAARSLRLDGLSHGSHVACAS